MNFSFSWTWVKRLFTRSPNAPRQYSLGGWKRGADGVYRSGDGDSIYRRGRSWFRDGSAYPTLRAAIYRLNDPGPLFTGADNPSGE